MLRKIIRALILVPLALVIVSFAVANRQIVVVSFDPFDTVDPAYSLAMPLFVLIIAMAILGVIIGGVAAWLRQNKLKTNPPGRCRTAPKADDRCRYWSKSAA